MKKIFPTFIDQRQNIFHGGRYLLHSSLLVVDEAIDEVKRRKKKCLIFKVDFENTYDLISYGVFGCEKIK